MQDTDGKGFVTDDNYGGFFVAQCPECEAIFNSGDCEPDNSMAGDGEAWCPLCLDNGDLHEIEERAVTAHRAPDAEHQLVETRTQPVDLWKLVDRRGVGQSTAVVVQPSLGPLESVGEPLAL